MIALLFMKGHSERLPGKNVRPMCGKPLFYWTISALLDSPFRLKRIYIDTDSEDIASMVKDHFSDLRVRILSRPKELLGDSVTANQLIRGIVKRVSGEYFFQAHVTTPLLKPETIDRAINNYFDEGEFLDSLISVTEHRSNFYDMNGFPINHNPAIVTMTQNRDPVYEENSAFYIFSRAAFLSFGRCGRFQRLFPISKVEGIDIDTEEDWKMAEAVMRNGF